MVSTYGIETARRALHAQRSALYTTSHNIANANTKGYTRQRVNFSTTNPYNAIFGQIGTGVQEGSIERIRESFLDVQSAWKIPSTVRLYPITAPPFENRRHYE